MEATDACDAVQGRKMRKKCARVSTMFDDRCQCSLNPEKKRGKCGTCEKIFDEGPTPGPTPDTPVAEGIRTATVFGFKVIADPSISEKQFLHALGVVAEMLDNDGDKCVDDENVYMKVTKKNDRVGMVLHEGTERAREVARGQPFFRDVAHGVETWKGELLPECAASKATSSCRDATVEEAFHGVSYGFALAYPMVFGTGFMPGQNMRSSQLMKCMKVARGGVTGPGRPLEQYPPEAWYTYNDPTCDKGCQASEYHYWATMAAMDIQLDFCLNSQGQQPEWALCTSELLASKDKCVLDLLQSTAYRHPTRPFQGSYSPVGAAELAQDKCSGRCCSA